MDTTAFLPTPPTSGAIMHSGSRNDDFFGIWAGIEATNRNGSANQAATTNAANSINKNVTDAAVSTTKTVTDYGMMNAETTNRNATAVTKAVTDASLSSSLDFGRLHSEIISSAADTRGILQDGFTANAIAAKDIQIAIYKDGCETREKSAEQFAALQLQACKDTAELAKQIAACCCKLEGEHATTRTLILSENTKRLESELQDARLKAAIAGISKGNNGNGNS